MGKRKERERERERERASVTWRAVRGKKGV